MSRPASEFDLNGMMAARVCDGETYAVHLLGTVQVDGSMVIDLRGYRYDGPDLLTAEIASETRETLHVDPAAAVVLMRVFS